MKVFPGVRVAHLMRSTIRPDNVKGLCAKQSIGAGEAVLSVPFRYCAFPNGWSPSSVEEEDRPNTAMVRSAQVIRNANRQWSLFPEAQLWLRRFSPDAASPVQLTGSASTMDDRQSVSLSVTPVEASAATCAALRYFYTDVARLQHNTRLRIGPKPDAIADHYVQSLPIARYLHIGVESLHSSQGGEEAHMCIEIISQNMREAVLESATNEEYSLLDRNSSAFDELLLTCLYIARARVFKLPVLHPQPELDYAVNVMAPFVDLINHGGSEFSNVVGAISPQNESLVVRAKRPIRRGEELLLDYTANGAVDDVEDITWFSNRYLFNSVTD
ncbi:hypothetical protein AGDE_03687 [Angomonas deanei]|nr:hypothetical protein AGDE_03687 [Angomonas deanei]|eukprot:EPY40241.1 hypothetical protein AGDE_03687 [Angomonas deanei]